MDKNEILIGEKPLMSYVLAALANLNGGSNYVIIKARGSKISKAVDVSQVLKSRFFKDSKISVEIGTEQLPSKKDPNVSKNVSFISIKLEK
ncbi:MAG: RNA-binding protein [Candidatus Rehaiarchaeum fermentans]|nr:RNA-binding protein [Candidatus Rehaiarchaeum fermentans]